MVSHPAFTTPLFVGSLYGLYFTPLVDFTLSTGVGHLVMIVHFLVTGLLFFGGVLAVDPWPQRSSHPVRILELVLSLPMHAFFGVAVMAASAPLVRAFSHPPPAWGIDAVVDQSMAGSVAWMFGELPTVIVLGVVFSSWMRSDERRARSLDRTAVRDGGADLAAYNAHLAQLAAASGDR